MADQSPVRTGRHAGHRHRPRRRSVHQATAPLPVLPRLPVVFEPALRPGERILAWAPANTEGFHVALFGGVLPWFLLNAHYLVAVTDAGRILFVHTAGERVRGVLAFPLSDVTLVACNHRFLGGVVLWFRLPQGAAFDSCLPHGRPRRLGFAAPWASQACAMASMISGSHVRPTGLAF